MLNTEKRNPNTINIDKMSSLEMVKAMQVENYNSVKAIETEISSIALAIDEISSRMKNGGRLFYVGCGTSGRLGVVDAAECPPTFGVDKGVVNGIIAGGHKTMVAASEDAEDNYNDGYNVLDDYSINEKDSVVGISVAGGAEYVYGAINKAKEKGALTIGLTCNEGSKIDECSDIKIHPNTGAEVITGSTRLKAGSAHKMILNMISTCVMVKQGYVYENLMINLRPSNKKLRDRMIRIVSDITNESLENSEKLLNDNDFVIRTAVENYGK